MFIIDREGRITHVHRGYPEDVLASSIKERLVPVPRDVLERRPTQ